MLALVDGVPRTLNLAEMIGYYVDHQVDVVTRRTRFELRKAEERDHIVQGLLIALDHLDEVIKIIRGSQDAEAARTQADEAFKLSRDPGEPHPGHAAAPPDASSRAPSSRTSTRSCSRASSTSTALLKDPKKLRGVIKDELARDPQEARRRRAAPRSGPTRATSTSRT